MAALIRAAKSVLTAIGSIGLAPNVFDLGYYLNRRKNAALWFTTSVKRLLGPTVLIPPMTSLQLPEETLLDAASDRSCLGVCTLSMAN